MQVRTDLERTVKRVRHDIGALYSSDRMERMRTEINAGSYKYLGRGFQHKAYLDPAAHRVVKTPRTVEEIVAPLRLGIKLGVETAAQQRTNACKIIENTLNSYVPAITRGGKQVWPTDLVSDINTTVDRTSLVAPIAITQREFTPDATASGPKPIFDSGDTQEIAAFFDAYLGLLYTLSRHGLFIRDWINFENVIMISRGGAGRLALLDPFFNLSKPCEVRNLARNFASFFEREIQQLVREEFPYWRLFGDTAIAFICRYKIFDNFGTDLRLAERVPGSFDFEAAA